MVPFSSAANATVGNKLRIIDNTRKMAKSFFTFMFQLLLIL